MNSDFKQFFDKYFDYDFNKLQFIEGLDAFPLFSKSFTVSYLFSKAFSLPITDFEFVYIKKTRFFDNKYNYYGFFRIKSNNFYTPFSVFDTEAFQTPYIEINTLFSVRNSAFEFCFMPIKKTQNLNFIYGVFSNFPPKMQAFLGESRPDILFFLNNSKSFKISFDISRNLLELVNKEKEFVSTLTLKNFNLLDGRDSSYIDYSLFLCKSRTFLELKSSCLESFGLQDLIFNNFPLYDHYQGSEFHDFESFSSIINEVETVSKIYNY